MLILSGNKIEITASMREEMKSVVEKISSKYQADSVEFKVNKEPVGLVLLLKINENTVKVNCKDFYVGTKELSSKMLKVLERKKNTRLHFKQHKKTRIVNYKNRQGMQEVA